MTLCQKCGKELKESDKFCPGCGIKIKEDELKKAKPREKVLSISLVNVVLLVIIGIVILGVIALIIGNLTNKKQEMQYTCPDGSKVSNPNYCPKATSRTYCGDGICQKGELYAEEGGITYVCSADCPKFEFRGARWGYSWEGTRVVGDMCTYPWYVNVLNEGAEGTDTLIVRGYDKFDWQKNNQKTIVYEKKVPIPKTGRGIERKMDIDIQIKCDPRTKKPYNEILWAYELEDNFKAEYTLSVGWEPKQYWE